MKANLTEIVCILDMSGSMIDLTTDTIGGYNAFIKEQKSLPGDAFVSTVLFNDQYYMIHNHVDIKEISPLTGYEYRPRGGTALMDAVGKAINDVGYRLNDTPEEERPSHVIFMITTDGYENASREFNRAQIKRMIEHQRQKYSWEFIFIGAGIDAYTEAESMGLDGLHAMNVSATSVGASTLFDSASKAAYSVRTTGCINSADWKNGQTATNLDVNQ